jgi:hypothetical protein
VSDVTNHVRLSESGLLIEIETMEAGQVTGSVQIDRRAWPAVVATVAACMTERRVRAEVDTIADDAASEGAED